MCQRPAPLRDRRLVLHRAVRRTYSGLVSCKLLLDLTVIVTAFGPENARKHARLRIPLLVQPFDPRTVMRLGETCQHRYFEV